MKYANDLFQRVRKIYLITWLLSTIRTTNEPMLCITFDKWAFIVTLAKEIQSSKIDFLLLFFLLLQLRPPMFNTISGISKISSVTGFHLSPPDLFTYVCTQLLDYIKSRLTISTNLICVQNFSPDSHWHTKVAFVL